MTPATTLSAPYQALPPPAAHGTFTRAPGVHAVAPAVAPWPLRPLASAASGVDRLPDGRIRYWIRHAVLRGVTPAMLAWWFAHLEGTVEIGGRTVERYRAWHPHDHVAVRYARRRADGSVGPGAVIHLRERLGGNPAFTVDVHTEIEKLDEEGFIHNPVVHGLRGMARMEYRYQAVAGGTLYENCIVVGSRSRLGRLLQPWVECLFFPPGKGVAWLRHNVEEVGLLEHLLPDLYRREVGTA